MGIFITNKSGTRRNNSSMINSENNSNSSSVSGNYNDHKQSILRCPKCRSINPQKATYCNNCGLVFKSKSID